MSTSRWGQKWADVDEDDDDEVVQDSGDAQNKNRGARFETPPDKDGIKTVIEYIERDGKTYKVTKRVRVNSTKKWTNQHMTARKTMEKFGKPRHNDANAEKALCVRSEEEVPIEIPRKGPILASTKDDAEDKFLEESLQITENLFKEKKVWTDMNRSRQEDREVAGVGTEAPAAAAATPAAAPAAAAAAPAAGGKGGAPGAYVPPSLRGKDGGKGDGKGKDNSQEASLRITNLSEDVREGDLQDLFGQFGRLSRVYLAKDPNTFQCKGFAFVTYYGRDEAQRAINKLHGHGYDNLILQVQWAKPKD